MEITDKRVWIQMGRLEAIGEQTGHTFEITNEGNKYKYCIWMDNNKVSAVASCLSVNELIRYVDGLRDMFLILTKVD